MADGFSGGSWGVMGTVKHWDNAQAHFGGIKAASSLSVDTTWTLPTADSAGFLKSNGSGVLSIATLVASDLPVMVGSGASHAPGAVPDPGASAGTTKYLREDGTWAVPPDTNSGGTVTSVGISMPAMFTVSGTPITGSGTLTAALANQNANLVFSGPASGTAAPTFRSLVLGDLPTISLAKGGTGTDLSARAQYSIVFVDSSGGSNAIAPNTSTAREFLRMTGTGTVGGLPAWDTLIAGDLPSHTHNASDITGTLGIAHGGTGQTTANAALNAFLPSQGANSGRILTTDGTNTSWTPSGTGSVTSVDLSMPVGAGTQSIFNVSGNPITTSGTLAVGFATQSANTIFSGPTNGAADIPSFRALVAADIPGLAASKITSGTLPMTRGGVGSDLSGKSQYSLMFVDSSGGSNAVAPNTSTAKEFLSMTGTGSVGATPVWGTLAAGDIPSLAASIITSGTFPEARGGTNQSTYTLGDMLYASAANTLAKLAGNTSATPAFLKQVGTGSVSAAPSWQAGATGWAAPSSSCTQSQTLSCGGLADETAQNDAINNLRGVLAKVIADLRTMGIFNS